MADLWRTSGHLDWYQDGMFPGLEIDKRSYFLKPMNCPFHCLIFKSQHRSYRELPLRFAEWGTVYRYEPSGTLHGLMRVRGFTQDDAHIFCSPETIEEEVAQVIRFVSDILRHFGLNDIQAYVSTRNPEKFIGDPKEWGLPTQTLASALAQVGIPFQYDEGEAAFYGPKIDIKAKDRLGRTWQLSTIQFDFNLPRRFDLTYIGPDGKEHYPYLIHRALLGSLERFLGILIEHFGGAFPIWLAPKQVAIVPVKESHIDYAKQVHQALVAQRCRSFVDVRPKGMGQKVRDAKKSKIPFIAVVGDKEIENATVSVQSRDEQGKPMAVPVSRLVQMLKV
jgi:threonyl-tRNA synthetase